MPAHGAGRLQPGHGLRLRFSVPVPAPLPAPSSSTPDFTLRWLLRAVVDPPRRPGPWAVQEVVLGGTVEASPR